MGASTVLLCGVVLIHVFASQTDAQRPRSPWKTLSGDAPRVISRGGFSGLFPDSSLDAYNFALQTSVADAILWCDVQLTKDGAGICFPDLNMSNASTIEVVYPKGQKTYPVNGVPTQGWFTVDFSLKDLNKVYLIRGILSRSDRFDGNGYTISTVQTVNIELRPRGLWLNVQHDAFYAQNNLSMSNFLISASKNVSIDYISSPEVNFFTKIAGRFGHNGPIFVFRFLEKETFEPTTNRSYGSILSNLTFVKTFASGILVPKSYVLPLDDKQYLLPSTSLVQDAHKAGLEVFVSGFANDVDIAHDYSYDPVSEYLSFVDNGNFSVDGVLSDFPISASASVECFSHLRRNATKQVDFLVISKNGASGDYPGCTDLAYDKAIRDGAGVIDCSVQMSRDGKPFCSHSIDLSNITNIAQTSFAQRSTHVPEISSNDGIYTFSLTWSEIQSLIPAISNPYRVYNMFRNPNEKKSGKLILLSEFLKLAKHSTSLSGVLISVENAMYLRQKQGLNMVKAVLDTLTETAYSTRITTTKVMIQSTDSSVLVEFRNQSKYETVYKVEKTISDISDSAIEEIKEFASAVVITKVSVFPTFYGFVTGQTNVVERLQKSQLPVYVELFQNEFVSQPYDFFSDATVEINSYVTGAGVNGTITEFPFTAARYRRNKCLGSKETLPYMAPVQPGGLLEVVSPASLPPAEAPNPVFTDADVPGYDHYKQCSQTFLCGNQGGLLYPFWTPDRETCGYPGFKLNCSQGFAELTVSSVKFRILNANYTSRNIRLARSDYIDNICPSDPLNGPFYQNALQLANDTNLLTMLYDCQDLSSIIYSSEAYNYVTDFQCKEGVKNNNYCVVINSSSSLFNGRDGIDYMKENCTDYVSMPFSGSNLHTLDSNNLKKTLEQGFELQLKQDCSMCPATSKMGPLGGDKGNTFDDGVLDGVKKVTIGADEYSVTYIKIEYANDGNVEIREHGTNRGELKEFSVAYPNEYITAVGGSYKHIFNYDTTLITSLYFTTSKGLTSPLFGEIKGREFEYKDENGGNLVGFHGRGGYAIDAIGVHFAPAPNSSIPTPPNKLSKVYITSGNEGIEEINFYNVENGVTKEVFLHGVKGKNLISTLVISNPPDECLVSVESWYSSYNVSQGIKFKTDTNGSNFFGYKFSEDTGRPFSLQVKGKKIIGVQKFPDSNLISPGTYFVLSRSSSPDKVEAIGGKGGETFDDGAFNHVRKVFVGKGDSGIAYVKFDYEKDGRIVTQEHGQKTSQETEVFEIGQDDDITSVKAYYETLDGSKTETITYLAFKTLKGINSQPFGKTPVIVNENTKLSLLEGGKITGFHGSSTDVLHSIGAYISASPPTMLHGKWIQVEQNGKTPGPRCSHAIAMVGNKMYSFGGELKPNFHIDRDLYFFDFETRRWSIADPDGDVPELPCLGVCMVAIGTTLYVFGGRDGFRNYNGFYSYDTVKSEWKLITHVNNGPAPRSFHSMAADGNNIYIFGGVTTKERVNTLHAYNIVDQKWTELPNPGESCKGRGGAGLVVVQGKIWVVYGFIGEEVEDVHCFDPVESKWTKVETRGEKPWARSVFALAVVGKYIIISGGEIEMDVKAHLGPGSLTGGAFVLDTESLVWEKLEEGHSPRGWIASTTASIDGKKGLLMYGGKAPTNGRYEDIYFYGVDSA